MRIHPLLSCAMAVRCKLENQKVTAHHPLPKDLRLGCAILPCEDCVAQGSGASFCSYGVPIREKQSLKVTLQWEDIASVLSMKAVT